MRHNRELASHPPIILVHPVDLGVSFLLSGSRLPISRRHRWACALPEPRLSPKHQHHFVRSTAKARERRRRPALTVDAAPGVEIGTLPGRNDAAAFPGVLGAAPLEGEQQADDGGEEEGCALEVEFADLLREGGVDLCGLPLDGEEGDDEGGGYGAEGEVDVEAPAPGEVVGEGAAEAGRC